MYPFEQIVKDNKLVRTFLPEVENEELVWHRDLRNRVVTIIESGGWKFQKEDELPINLNNGDIITIHKDCWHRVIKGNNKLIVEIEEF